MNENFHITVQSYEDGRVCLDIYNEGLKLIAAVTILGDPTTETVFRAFEEVVLLANSGGLSIADAAATVTRAYNAN